MLGSHEHERQIAIARSSRTSASTRCSCSTVRTGARRRRSRVVPGRSVLVDRGVVRVNVRPAVRPRRRGWPRRTGSGAVAGHAPTIRSTAGRKPMSSIRSASSSTSIRIAVERERAACEQILEPSRRRHEHVRAGGLLGLLDAGRPRRRRPVTRSAREWAIARMSSTICVASSRVGASTSADGRGPSARDPLDERDPERERLARAGG